MTEAGRQVAAEREGGMVGWLVGSGLEYGSPLGTLHILWPIVRGVYHGTV